MSPELAAVHELVGVIAEILDPAIGFDLEDRKRISAVKVRCQTLVTDLVINQKFPTLAAASAQDLREASRSLREYHAELGGGR